MAELRKVDGSRWCILQPEHLIGRGPQCALRLAPEYVSSQHAVVRWNGAVWQVLDRGSRNGTYVNARKIVPGSAYALEQGTELSFGQEDERWILSDAREPQVMVVSLDNGASIVEVGGVIGLPSAEDPQCTLYRAGDGSWRLELPDRGTFLAEDRDTFEAGGTTWRFVCPALLDQTAAADLPERAEPVLELSVSSDEEFVEAALRFGERTVALGSRAQNYVLLTLARARTQDVEAGVAESACGWVHKDELARQLRMTPQQVDGEVFRIRKHFGQHGLAEAATVIERRPRTTQLRLGLARTAIRSL